MKLLLTVNGKQVISKLYKIDKGQYTYKLEVIDKDTDRPVGERFYGMFELSKASDYAIECAHS